MVEFNGVSKTYDKDFVALKKVDLSIKDGEFVFVVGASGAGKSTFLKLIMREQVPSSGTITINGFNLNTMKKRDIPYFRRTMGIVFQDFRLIPDMRVYDNVAFALRVTGTKEREVRKRVTHALGMVGLLSKTHSLPKELSGGEQQRVAIARALVNNADLIIADEPTGNIDPAMSVEIMDLLNHINKANGTTVVMVTHAHELVRQYNHRIVVLKEGEIIADGYDKDKILALINPEQSSADAGFYHAPNEYADVEKFIVSYGKENAPIDETIPVVPDNESFSEAQDDVVPVSQEVLDLAEKISATHKETATTEKKTSSTSYSVADDTDISSILAAFTASTEAKKKEAAAKKTSGDINAEKPSDDNAGTDEIGGDENEP